MDVAILDFSWYENECDPLSDALIARALNQLGVNATVIQWPPGKRSPAPAERIWLRYDLRSPQDLAWVVECTLRLRMTGVSVFPSPESLLWSEDKWLTDCVLRRQGLPLPQTWLASRLPEESFQMILKPRIGWGGENSRVIRGPHDPASQGARHDGFIAQRFIPNERTLIAAVADGRPITCIEDRTRTTGFSCRAKTVPFTEEAVNLACRALEAIGLIAGTVDMIETPEGLCILEINSAPRLTYPDLDNVDLAGPMARAVVKGWCHEG